MTSESREGIARNLITSSAERSHTKYADNSFPPDDARAGCRVGSVAGSASMAIIRPQLLHHPSGIILVKQHKSPFKWRHFEPTVPFVRQVVLPLFALLPRPRRDDE